MARNPKPPADDYTPPWERDHDGGGLPEVQLPGDTPTDPEPAHGPLDPPAAHDYPAPPDETGEPVPEVIRPEVLERLERGAGRYEPGATRGSEIAVIGPNTARVVELLDESARSVDASNANVMEDIFGRIMNAESAEAVLADDDTIDPEQILGVAIQVWDFSTFKSDFEGPLRWYVALKAVRLDNREDIVVTTGAQKVLAQMVKLKSLKALPVMVKFVKKERATQAGYHPYALVMVR